MDLGIAGKVAVVTGAGRGIGREVALALAKEGARVALISRTLSELAQVAEEIGASGGTAEPFLCDVSRRPQVLEVAEGIAGRLGAPQILVNNAAARSEYARVEALSDVAYDTTVRENLEPIFSVTKAFLPAMKEAGWGRVINLGSLVGEIGGHGQLAYATAKAALVGFTRTLAVEYGRQGVTANLVIPAIVDTERIRQVLSERTRDLVMLRSAIKRLGRPGEVAAAVAFLASEQAGYITGACLHVTGGYELNFG
jgi:NAD(P)-dependent dehydrogenase (short-subunit alcohol dehydrogenase family)